MYEDAGLALGLVLDGQSASYYFITGVMTECVQTTQAAARYTDYRSLLRYARQAKGRGVSIGIAKIVLRTNTNLDNIINAILTLQASIETSGFHCCFLPSPAAIFSMRPIPIESDSSQLRCLNQK